MRQRRAKADVAALLSALVAFHRANNNLNQLAYTGNVMKQFAAEYGAKRVGEIGQELVQAVEALRGDFAPVLATIDAAIGDDSEG